MTILVLRLGSAGEELVSQLEQCSIQALLLRLLAFESGRQLHLLATHLAWLRPGDLAIALSPRAVSYANSTLPSSCWPQQIHYLAIGPSTAAALEQSCDHEVLYPDGQSTSETLLLLPLLQNILGKRILLLRGNGGRNLLSRTLRQRGATVVECECYRRVLLADWQDGWVEVWRKAGVDCIVATSGQLLWRLHSLLAADQNSWIFECLIVVVSERLAAIARRYGWGKVALADGADNSSLLNLLQQIARC